MPFNRRVPQQTRRLIEKISALIPPPYVHLTRYFGVFGPHSGGLRKKIILKPHVKKGFVAVKDEDNPSRMSWGILLKRAFKIDIQRCPNCGHTIDIQQSVVFDDPVAIRMALRALKIDYHPPPIKPARYVAHTFDFDQTVTYPE